MAVDTARLLDSGANGYIAKPFSMKRTQRRARARVRQVMKA